MAIFTNQARLTYNGLSVNSNVVTGEIVEVLSVDKTALNSVYRIGQRVVYAVSILNSGTAAASDLTLSDDLGGYSFNGNTLYPLTYISGSVRYFVNGTLQPTPTVLSESPLLIGGISVPAGGNAMILYETEVSDFASPESGATIDNTATVSGTGASSATAEESITAMEGPSLSISKSLSPLTIPENGRLTYTFVLENSGTAAVAADNLSVIDVFNPVLSDLTVTLNGAPFSAYTYDSASGIFQTTPGAITIPGADFVQDPVSGQWQTDPGSAVLVVSGTV